jgi:DNA invertase Pin-like site-specific DNA recombinase
VFGCVSPQIDTDPNDPFGRFALTLFLALAEMERARIGQNWDTATARAIAAGRWCSPFVPFGYRLRDDARFEVDRGCPDRRGTSAAIPD